jgi:hypothetical protein
MEQQPTAALIKALGDGDKAGMDALRELAQGCPACMLTAIRCSGLLDPLGDREFPQFDFAKEAAAFWSDVNAEERENDYTSYQGCW